jgi:hypothetical protein
MFRTGVRRGHDRHARGERKLRVSRRRGERSQTGPLDWRDASSWVISHAERSFLISFWILASTCMPGGGSGASFGERIRKIFPDFSMRGFMARWTGAEIMNRIHCYREEFRRVFVGVFQG